LREQELIFPAKDNFLAISFINITASTFPLQSVFEVFEMNLAYIISAYKYPTQLLRLIHKLKTDGATFFVHIDQKSDPEIYRAIREGTKQLEQVYFLERHKCYWGDFGHVRATIKGIQAILREKVDFDYVTLLTGQCYPLKTNQEIKTFFREHNGQSFMEYYPVTFPWSKRIDRWHFQVFSKRVPFPNKLLQLPIKRPQAKQLAPFFRGSSY
jgi:hypothetical protein